VIKVLVEFGTSIEAGEDLFEVETNKATMAVSSPCAGKVGHIIATVNTSYAVGAHLAALEITEVDAKALGIEEGREVDPPQKPKPNGSSKEGVHFQFNEDEAIHEGQPVVEPIVGGLPVPAGVGGASYISPRMRARMAELGLNSADLAGVAGTGAGGRVTVEDFEHFLRSLEQHRMTPASPMRIAVADSMRRAWARPLATVGSPVIMDALLSHRKKATPRPGPALYAIRALALALAENTAMAGRLYNVNTFDQPGVEAYKQNLMALMGKPGLEDLAKSLKRQLGQD
jgi:pyruvate/2-oxoglutarate dehydrogenase complex dihydrolipoamide acyltransferase (E2) component